MPVNHEYHKNNLGSSQKSDEDQGSFLFVLVHSHTHRQLILKQGPIRFEKIHDAW